MKTDLLTIVLPTCDHPQYVDYYLKNSAYINKYNILLAIHDSSINDETYDIVNRYNYDNVIYYRYSHEMDIDEKTILALKKVETKYAFLCGDGIILKESSIDRLEKLLGENPTIIEYYNIKKEWKYISGKTNYNDILKFKDPISHFKTNMWHMILYGGSFVKSSLFSEVEVEKYREIIGTGFIYPFIVYDRLLSHNDDFFAYSVFEDYAGGNPYKKASGWIKNKKFAKIWFDNFPSAITKLPNEYQNYFLIAIKRHNDLKFSFKTMVSFRESGNFSLKIYKQYKENFLKYSSRSNIIYIIIALIPRFPLTLFKKVYRCIKRCITK